MNRGRENFSLNRTVNFARKSINFPVNTNFFRKVGE